jgi:hypothetical protein
VSLFVTEIIIVYLNDYIYSYMYIALNGGRRGSDHMVIYLDLHLPMQRMPIYM